MARQSKAKVRDRGTLYGVKNTNARSQAYDEAVQGKPVYLNVSDEVLQACIVRGIRQHPGAGTHLRDVDIVYTRALNARAIMSDQIPEMNTLEEMPYCIWYPDIAKEETYRALALAYPSMKYQVGRACAAAGYFGLYWELDLIPDVHIAEEARDSGCQEIFDSIMAHSKLYSVMDDMSRTVCDDITVLQPTRLSADTQVRSWLLGHRRRPQLPRSYGGTHAVYPKWLLQQGHYHNITEDFCVDVFAAREAEDEVLSHGQIKAQRLALSYLYTPLPQDLPMIDKDILILVAAHTGDVDRYARLRRQYMIHREFYCVIRGKYHNTFFAKWWSMLQEKSSNKDCDISRAIVSRAIMDNDLSTITAETPKALIPYNIWWPKMPHTATLLTLLEVRPDMKPQIARAFIISNKPAEWDFTRPDYDPWLEAEARASSNTHFLDDLQKQFPDFEALKSMEPTKSEIRFDKWKHYTYTALSAPDINCLDLVPVPTAWDIMTDFPWFYDGHKADISRIELRVSSIALDQDIDGSTTIRTSYGDSANAALEDGHIFDVSRLWDN